MKCFHNKIFPLKRNNYRSISNYYAHGYMKDTMLLQGYITRKGLRINKLDYSNVTIEYI